MGADPDTARLVAQCYPDAKSKQDLYNKYKKQGYSAQDAKKLANREIIHGEEATKKYIKDNNVKKSDPDYTATSPRDNVNTDWRTQERLNAQRNAGAGKGNESGNKSGRETVKIDEFFIDDWTGYPDAPKPDGPFRILEGTEYTDARNLANKTNANIHRNRPDLKGTQIHEMHPVKLGGSPTDIDNKIALSPKEHAKYTAFWNKVLREQKGKLK